MTKANPFKTIRAMTTKERKAICDHNLTKGSVYGCQVGGVTYTDCGECPMATAADMQSLVRTVWCSRMKRIGYFI